MIGWILLSSINVKVVDAKHSMGLFMLDGTLVVFSSLLFDDADEFALGVFNHGGVNVVVLFIDKRSSLDGVIFASKLTNTIEFDHITHVYILETVHDHLIVLGNQQRTTCNLGNSIVSKLIAKLGQQALGRSSSSSSSIGLHTTSKYCNNKKRVSESCAFVWRCVCCCDIYVIALMVLQLYKREREKGKCQLGNSCAL